jgi:hypothetical protein
VMKRHWIAFGLLPGSAVLFLFGEWSPPALLYIGATVAVNAAIWCLAAWALGKLGQWAAARRAN